MYNVRITDKWEVSHNREIMEAIVSGGMVVNKISKIDGRNVYECVSDNFNSIPYKSLKEIYDLGLKVEVVN
jgi:hypothetical protein